MNHTIRKKDVRNRRNGWNQSNDHHRQKIDISKAPKLLIDVLEHKIPNSVFSCFVNVRSEFLKKDQQKLHQKKTETRTR